MAPSASDAASVVATNRSSTEGARLGVMTHTPRANTTEVMKRRRTGINAPWLERNARICPRARGLSRPSPFATDRVRYPTGDTEDRRSSKPDFSSASPVSSVVEILIPQRARTAAHAVARSLARTWPRRHIRIDVGELGLGQDPGRVWRHLGAGRPDRARERRERHRIRSQARSCRRALRLAAVALIAADANEGLFSSVGATTVRLQSDTTDVTLRPRHDHTP